MYITFFQSSLQTRMPPPMNQSVCIDSMNTVLSRDGATFIGKDTETIQCRTNITYRCICGKVNTKQHTSLIRRNAFCKECTYKMAQERRIKTMTNNGDKPINNGSTDFSEELAKKTADRNGSRLLGIYRIDESGVRHKREGVDLKRTKRDDDLHCRCSCGTEFYVNFRNAYENDGCRCRSCQKAKKSEALRNKRRSTPDAEITMEHLTDRAARIEREGQKCIDCNVHQDSEQFAKRYNHHEKCYVFNGRCRGCSRKLRTSNREDALRNASLEEFLNGELVIARDRVKKYNKTHPDSPREFNITVEHLVEAYENQNGKCAISGRNMLTITHRDECPDGVRCNPEKLSIDRIDSTSGYVEGNIQLVCWIPNSIKMDMSTDELENWVISIYNHRHLDRKNPLRSD